MPVTVLRSTESDANGPPDDATERVRAASEESIAKAKQSDEMREGTIHVQARWPTDNDLEQSIKAEADKGHDLMFLGVGSINEAEVRYSDDVRREAGCAASPTARCACSCPSPATTAPCARWSSQH